MTQLERVSVAHPATDAPTPRADSLAMLRHAVELTKPRITKLVTITSGVGFAMALLAGAGPASGFTLIELVWVAFIVAAGTALSSSGAGALNEWWERERDARMRRTRTRPIPDGRLTSREALWIGLSASVGGVGLLWIGANWAAALVALLTILSYVLIYTPLKPVTPLATIVGAFPGALPPLIGWSAVAAGPWHGLDALGGWSLFLIMFVWQIPHFLAIAWKYRDDYALGGFRVLPVVDPSGLRTSWAVMLWSVALLPVSLSPIVVMNGVLGWAYAACALALGLVMVVLAAQLAISRADAHARRLFFASIIYLPLLLLAMVADGAARVLL